MTRFHLFSIASCLALTLLATQTTHARGFGGMHGGGMHSGGMHGGGMHMSAPRMGGNFGGSRPNYGVARANMGGSRSNLGGARANMGGNFGAARANSGGSRANSGSGRPNAGGSLPGGFSLAGGFSGRGTSGAGSRNSIPAGTHGSSTLADRGFSPGGHSNRGFPGGSTGGFGKEGRGDDKRGAREGANGALGSARSALDAAERGKRTDRSQLNSFLGLPSDHGMHSVTSHAINHRATTDHAVNRRATSNHAVNWRHTADDLSRHGDYVRRNFDGRGFYNRDWYRRYPGCWYPRRWAYGTVWAVWDWDYLNGWFGYNEEPIYYDYGNTVVYQDNSVYVNGEDVGTSDEYYQQASDLADAGADAGTDTSATGDDGEWLPLGVFAMSHDDQTKANLILQLAVNKQGIIRGNYTATVTNDTKPLQGSVDKNTQRAAWTIGDNKENVFETGVDNLTKDEAPMLVHYGKDKTEQWTLVRLKNNDDSSATPSDADGNKAGKAEGE